MCKLIFRRFITVNGTRVYPKKAKAFAFWVPVDDVVEHKLAA